MRWFTTSPFTAMKASFGAGAKVACWTRGTRRICQSRARLRIMGSEVASRMRSPAPITIRPKREEKSASSTRSSSWVIPGSDRRMPGSETGSAAQPSMPTSRAKQTTPWARRTGEVRSNRVWGTTKAVYRVD
jgi:hypothetical protein